MREFWWATVNKRTGSVCLWASREQAREGKDDEERVTCVRVTEAVTK